MTKIIFYQKTAKELLIFQSHSNFGFCMPFFNCEAPNFVENCVSLCSNKCTRPWNTSFVTKIILYQKTAKELLIFQSHFMFRFL